MEEEQKKLHVDATMENLDAVIGFVEEQLQEAACPGKVCGQICVSVEEIYVNIVNYAYGGRVGPCAITTSIEPYLQGGKICLTIEDQGIPFNPLEREDPNITLSAEERKIGGLGIYMVKKSMDEVSYAYVDGYNTITLVKKW